MVKPIQPNAKTSILFLDLPFLFWQVKRTTPTTKPCDCEISDTDMDNNRNLYRQTNVDDSFGCRKICKTVCTNDQ